MGFTLIHRKDGKEIPIKMSIWDAFHGVPDPKPRKPKPCTCCGKLHAKKDLVDNKKNDNGKKGEDKKDGNESGVKSGSWSTSPAVQFTSKDDKIILRMKTEDPACPWADIIKALGDKGTKSQIQERLKELRAKQGGSGKTDEQKEKDEEKKAVGEQKKAENQAKEKEGKGGKKNQKNNEGNADDKKSKKSGDMKAWADGFEKKKWVAMASKHYDKTGQRITPEMARKMAEEKS